MTKTFIRLAHLAAASAALAATSLAHAGSDVGVSVSINQPGFYGRVDIGNAPQPVVIYPQPVIIVPGPVAVHQRPIYLRVPPGHEKHWDKHCGEYRACGQPVYFVRYEGREERHDDDRDDRREGRGRGHDRGHGRGHGRH